MARPKTRNGMQIEYSFDKKGRVSDQHFDTKEYSNACYRGNHKQCKGINRDGNKCTCPKCNHPELESEE